MDNKNLCPWVSVNGFMSEEYRKVVVNWAITYYPRSAMELRSLATNTFDSRFSIPDSRSMEKVPTPILVSHILPLFQNDNDVASVVICLWAGAKKDLIEKLLHKGLSAGFHFKTPWDWHSGGKGYYAYENIPKFNEFIEKLITGYKVNDRDHHLLATLWLSGALPIEEVVQNASSIKPIGEKANIAGAMESQSTTAKVTEETKADSVHNDEIKKDPEVISIGSGNTEEPESDFNDFDLFEEMLSAKETAYQSAKSPVTESLQVLNTLIDSDNFIGFEDINDQLTTKAKVWKNALLSLADFLYNVRSGLIHKLGAISDPSLDTAMAALADGDAFSLLDNKKKAGIIQETLSSLSQYENEKNEVWKQIEGESSIIVKLREDVTILLGGDPYDFPPLPQYDAKDTDLHIFQTRGVLKELVDAHNLLDSKHAQLRRLSMTRIKSLTERAFELGSAKENSVTENIKLEDISDNNLQAIEIISLIEIEQSLKKIIEDRLAQVQKVVQPMDLSKLIINWSDKELINLLELLASTKKDIDAFLVLLSANKVHPRSIPLVLNRQVTTSLLNGMVQLANRVKPFDFLSLIAPQFCNNWLSDETTSQIELQIVLLTAFYTGKSRFPVDVLWQYPINWPDKKMVLWDRLWQRTLGGEEIHIIPPTDSSPEDELRQTRQIAVQTLAREHGMYLRLHSVKNKHHVALLRDEILPKIEDELNKVIKIESELKENKTTSEHINRLVSKLEDMADEWENEYSDIANEEWYDQSVNRAGINDEDPFHRRSSLHLIQDSTYGVIAYAKALANFYQSELLAEDQFRFEDLAKELLGIPDLNSFTRAALDQFATSKNDKQDLWDASNTEMFIKRHIIAEILSQSSYSLQFPHLVVNLVENDLDWSNFLKYVLDDIANPLEMVAVAALFLEHNAANQTVMLAQYLPLETQKSAQNMKRERERDIELIMKDLMQVGGGLDDLALDRELGRWPYLVTDLNKKLVTYKREHEAKEEKLQTQIRQIRAEIRELDDAIFDMRNEIPADVNQLLQDALHLSKKAAEKDQNFPAIQSALKEIRYRIEHESWPSIDISELVDQLQALLRGGSQIREEHLSAETVLELLEKNEIQKLGLSTNDIGPSAIGTRIDILSNWVKVQSASSLLYKQQKASERLNILSLFRYFAQMMKMQRSLDPDRKPISFNDPFIYEYWDLQYPKTAALDTHCLLMALPGKPPSSNDITEIEFIIEEKQWLDFFFIFLFIPGCTPKLFKRFQSNYRKKGLIIIDESTLVEMLLAERQGRNPLGILRPEMLNALEAQSTDVFKINQVVEQRSSIFTGRDTLIDKVASSASNYAIYGGRRIGKSSVMNAIMNRLASREIKICNFDFQGEVDCSDSAVAIKLAHKIGLQEKVFDVGSFKSALETLLEGDANLRLVIMLDEIDKYIDTNPERHTLIECFRAISDRYPGRFRVIIAGFMRLYDCLQGRGPYTPTSDPWRRMLNDDGPLSNLPPASAEGIVKEGFLEILGWQFENRSIPQRIVELTGGHPAFVQQFCDRVQKSASRDDRVVKLRDIETVFLERHPDQSFISYVRSTLEMNLDPIGRYLIVWLANESEERQGFTYQEMQEYAKLSKVPILENRLKRSLERLKVTGVIKEIATQVYEFSVPDYPHILCQLGETAELEKLENQLENYLQFEEDIHD